MIDRYIQFLGLEQTKQFLIANEKPLKPSIRVNTLKITVDRLKDRLENKGFQLELSKWFSYAFIVNSAPYNLGATHEFLQGYYYLQNIASMLPASILNPNSNDVVIDMCAAPGSKATHLAQIMKNGGILILIDFNLKRIPALAINLRRLGITNSIVMNYNSTDLSNLNLKADKILLDVPCTGEGLIRQDPKRKRSKKLNDIEKMAQIQKSLLKSGLNALKVGGKLLYSTCSIAPEENELVINDILHNMQDYRIIELPDQYGVNGLTEIYGKELNNELKFSQRLYPHLHDTIGFFFCLIKRIS
jgi:NOL1/NOP2/sun family putative RNA methylase